MNNFESNLIDLKYIFSVKNNKQLADKLGITEEAIKGWGQRKVIPKKYIKYINDYKNRPLVDFNKTTELQNDEDTKTIKELEKMIAQSIDRKVAIEQINNILEKINNEDLLKIMKNIINYSIKENNREEND